MTSGRPVHLHIGTVHLDEGGSFPTLSKLDERGWNDLFSYRDFFFFANQEHLSTAISLKVKACLSLRHTRVTCIVYKMDNCIMMAWSRSVTYRICRDRHLHCASRVVSNPCILSLGYQQLSWDPPRPIYHGHFHHGHFTTAISPRPPS